MLGRCAKRRGTIALLCLAVTGCAATNGAPADGGSGEAVVADARADAETAAVADAPVSDGAEGGDGVGGAQPAEPLDAPAPAIAQDYYMDENYILRPKDENGERRVALLTFDDGPKDEALLRSMLDTLDEHGAKAIFFVNGYRAERSPELLSVIRERGHAIGNHAWDHVDLKRAEPEEMERQIEDVQRFVRDVVGEAPTFFRPPFGAGDDAVKAKASEEGLLYMTWSNGSRDWMKGYDDPEKVQASVLEQLHPGSNILMHELPWTAEALDGLLEAIKAEGYEFLDPARIDPAHSKK